MRIFCYRCAEWNWLMPRMVARMAMARVSQEPHPNLKLKQDNKDYILYCPCELSAAGDAFSEGCFGVLHRTIYCGPYGDFNLHDCAACEFCLFIPGLFDFTSFHLFPPSIHGILIIQKTSLGLFTESSQ
ncbi:uncharacterized protein LOC135638264 [Musa acuminata AAA Group]|uniref:uncharacterized protein LOC135638264 n=1 Tax=Musa acuminata AAA Group TaxID=214697 RepID=UPI0031D42565